MAQQEHSRLGFHAYRRPTGAPPPLPKSIGFTGWLWLLVTFVVVGLASLWLHVSLSALHWVDGFITDIVVDVRMGWLDGTTRFFNTTASTGGIAVLAAGVILATGWFRRWRHIIICLISIAVVELAAGGLYLVAARPRPFGVVPIAGWEGFSSPSMPIAGLAAIGISAIYMLVVPGRPRYYAKWVLTAALVVSSLGRIYLGVDHATDVLFGAIVGVAIPVAAFRAFTPNDVFPVTYGSAGKSAHLDVTGRRGEAIRRRCRSSSGSTVTNIKPVGLEGSGGSTPLRIRVDERGRRDRTLFAKLYAKNHVRADRWYKLGRTMLYGRLEDETPFQTVRRFVEYEDYTLRLLGDVRASRRPAPLGIVEITPEREYLLVMEFFDGRRRDRRRRGRRHDHRRGAAADPRHVGHRARPPRHQAGQPDGPGRSAASDRRLLRAGAPVAVAPGGRPRQHDAGARAAHRRRPRLRRRRCEYFTPDELAEAFAATRGVASPTQLRQSMKQDGRDLLVALP